MDTKTLGLAAGAAILLGIGVYATASRSRENARLHEAALALCVKAPSDDARCRAAISEHHDECRTLATTVHSTGVRNATTTLAPAAYADCITRTPAVIRDERAALRRAEQERKAGTLR